MLNQMDFSGGREHQCVSRSLGGKAGLPDHEGEAEAEDFNALKLYSYSHLRSIGH